MAVVIDRSIDRSDAQEDLMVEYGGRCKLPPNIFTDGTIMVRA